MKKIILLILILPIFINAQEEEECAFVPTADFFDLSKFSRTVKSSFSDDSPYIFNIRFHVIYDSNHSIIITEDQILNQIAKLNINFNQFNIFFKYRGFDEITDDIYYTLPMGSYQILKNHFIYDLDLYDENAVNVFVLDSRSRAPQQDVIFSNNAMTNNESTGLIHEMGHVLGLVHTFSGSAYSTNFTQNNLPCPGVFGQGFVIPNLNSVAENVTRDVTDPNYNADRSGDWVTDTNAIFKDAFINRCWNTNGYVFYPHPEVVDAVGDVYGDIYELDDELFHNFMNYGAALNNFTNGQGVRMREQIENDTYNLYIPKLNLTTNGNPDISVLYEPYKVETIGTISDDIYSLTDNGDGTAEVCRLKSFVLNHYFQPGFDYSFYQGNTTNITHQADKDDLYGILDEGILRFVKINQINTSYLVNVFDNYTVSYSDIDNGIIFYEPSACLRPAMICETEPYSGGKVISTVNLANPNVDIKILTNQEASDPNLEQNLENNKFHIIEKTTISGAKIQKTIYKNGN